MKPAKKAAPGAFFSQLRTRIRLPADPQKRRRVIELSKDCLIIVLLLLAVFLIGQTGLFSDVLRSHSASTMGSSVTGEQVADSNVPYLPIRPRGLHIVTADGRRIGVAWDQDALTELYDGFSAAFAEALGSSTDHMAIDEAQWQQALLDCGVFFNFDCTLPLSLLSDRLGVSAGDVGQFYACMLCLRCVDDEVQLLFRAEPDGSFYSCVTAVSAAALRSRMEASLGPSATFAFEDPALDGLDPYFLLMERMPSVVNLTQTTAEEPDLDLLMGQLGMNSNIIRPYAEADGTGVYVDNGRTLRHSPDGSIHFKYNLDPADTDETESQHTGSAVSPEGLQLALSYTESLFNALFGDATLGFVNASANAMGEEVYRFSYFVDGVLVILPQGKIGLEITVQDRQVTRLEYTPFACQVAGENTHLLLPMAQAAAAASATGTPEQRRQLRLVYVDTGSEIVCQWIQASADRGEP